MSSVLAFDVQGQRGAIPKIGLGTATLCGDTCIRAVRDALRLGYRHIDTALLYNNQEAVGEAIKQAIAAGEITREELWVTSKVAFYPACADGKNTWVPIAFHEQNRKGLDATRAGVDECLRKLQLDYVDLMLIHNPCTALDDFAASGSPHAFELGKSMLTGEERDLVMQHRLGKVSIDMAAAEQSRAASWKALEEARAAGKCRFIGVSNYPPQLVAAMAAYATVMPAINQLELHPSFSSPSLQAMAKQMGMVLTAYGSGNSVAIEKSPVIAAIAQQRGTSAVAVVLQWTAQKGICIIPRTTVPAHMAENLQAPDAAPLTEGDVAAIDALNRAHCYYWWPLPLLPPGSKPDC